MVHSARPRRAQRYWAKASSFRSSFVLGEVESWVVMRISRAAGWRQWGRLPSFAPREVRTRRAAYGRPREIPVGRKDRNDSFMLISEGSLGSGSRRPGRALSRGGTARLGPIVLAELPKQQHDHRYQRRQRRDRNHESDRVWDCNDTCGNILKWQYRTISPVNGFRWSKLGICQSVWPLLFSKPNGRDDSVRHNFRRQRGHRDD
jgi:hypothetical protein